MRGKQTAGGLTIEQTGPNGWMVMGAGTLFGTALVIIALAVFSIAQYVGWALIIVAAGQFVLMTSIGIAKLIEARGYARALTQRERTYYAATIRQRPIPAQIADTHSPRTY